MSETRIKSKITSICLNDVLTEMYNIVICRIYTSLSCIKLSTKLMKTFGCRQSRIYGDDVSKIKYLPFSQIQILLLKDFKKQLYIDAKLVQNSSVPAIIIEMHLSLTK